VHSFLPAASPIADPEGRKPVRRLRHLVALAGGICTVLGALAVASPASATPVSPHPTARVAPRAALSTATELQLSSTFIAFDQETSWSTTVRVHITTGDLGPVTRGAATVDITTTSGKFVTECGPTFPSFRCILSDGQLPPGGYQIQGHYSDSFGQFASSDSAIASFVVTPEPTTPTLAVHGTLAYGQEAAPFEFSVSVAPRTAGRTPTGTADVILLRTSDQHLFDLCSGTLANGSTSCGLPRDTEMTPGTYTVFATYSGDTDLSPSSSRNTLQTLTITRGTLVPQLLLSQPVISEGQSEVLTAVLGGTGNPTGTVAFGDGTSIICSAPVVNDSASCTVSPGQLPIGSHHIVAEYSGDSNFFAASSISKQLNVVAASHASLTLSQPQSATFGSEQAEKLTVNVAGPGGTPTGQVTIKDGSKVLATPSLSGGTATFNLGATQLKPGSHTLTATYAGDDNFAASTSGTMPLTIAAGPTTTGLTLSENSIKAGNEQTEHLTVTVKPKFTGPVPTGKVTIKAGTTTLCTITLSQAKGSCKLSPSKLPPGTYHLAATYLGASPFARSTSIKRTLTVTK
jgi:large repetitive protein